jgi:predicted hydrolase (HD superfamily)
MRQAAHRYGEGPPRKTSGGSRGCSTTPTTRNGRKTIEAHRRLAPRPRRRKIAYAVSAHYAQWNVPYQSPLDRALLACDELTGFVVACCLVRPEGSRRSSPGA